MRVKMRYVAGRRTPLSDRFEGDVTLVFLEGKCPWQMQPDARIGGNPFYLKPDKVTEFDINEVEKDNG